MREIIHSVCDDFAADIKTYWVFNITVIQIGGFLLAHISLSVYIQP